MPAPAFVKRLLVVSYYFPPAGGPAVQRVLKTVKYLGRFGYAPTVLTVADGAFPQHDPSLADDVPEGTPVVRTRWVDPFGFYGRLTGKKGTEAVPVGSVGQGGGVEGLARWVRANVFLPDARVGWVPFAVREALRLHRDRPFEAVLTSGPPHSAHLIGRALKRRAGLPWLADFRDPWTGINYYDELPMSGPARRLDRRLERSVLREADRVVTVSPTWADELAAVSGRDRAAIAVIHNGFDAEDFAHLSRGPEAVATERFLIGYVGSMYATRNPEPLWAVLGGLRQAGAERLGIRLVGAIGEEVRASIAQAGLSGATDIVPYVPHDAAVRAMTEAGLLLLVIDPCRTERGILTGKLYEYLASGRPILALGPPDGDAARLLRETGGGAVFAPDDRDGIGRFIETHYAAWASGAPRPGAPASAVAPYAREAEAGAFAAELDGIV